MKLAKNNYRTMYCYFRINKQNWFNSVFFAIKYCINCSNKRKNLMRKTCHKKCSKKILDRTKVLAVSCFMRTPLKNSTLKKILGRAYP